MFSDLIPTVDIACVLQCTTLTLNPKESQRIFDFDQQISTKQKGKKKKENGNSNTEINERKKNHKQSWTTPKNPRESQTRFQKADKHVKNQISKKKLIIITKLIWIQMK